MRPSQLLRLVGALVLGLGVWLLVASSVVSRGRLGLAGLGGLAVAGGVAAGLWRPAVVAWCRRCGFVGEYSCVASAEAREFALVEEIVGGSGEGEPVGGTHVGLCLACATATEAAVREAASERLRVLRLRELRAAGKGGRA